RPALAVRRREVAVVLDAEAAHLVGAGLQILDDLRGANAQVVHDVAGVVVDAHAVVVHLARDAGARRPGAGLAAVLLDDKKHAVLARQRAELAEALGPELAVAAARVPER